MKATAEQLWDFFTWLERHPNNYYVVLFDGDEGPAMDIDERISNSLLEEYAREKDPDVPQ